MFEFFENMGWIGLLIYAILEAISLLPPTETVQLSVSSGVESWTLLWLAMVATIGTYIGIIIAWLLMKRVNSEKFIKRMFRNEKAIERAKNLFITHGNKTMIVAGLTPLPYSLVLYVALAAGMPLRKAIIGSSVSRILRFYMIAFGLMLFGNVMSPEAFSDSVSVVTIVITVLAVIGILGFLFAGKAKAKRQELLDEDIDEYYTKND